MCSSGNVEPLTTQNIPPVLTLQLKVAVDPNVALTDVGVLVKSEIDMNQTQQVNMTIQPATHKHSSM